jgi:Transcription elongation factor, GreA/GreB, C-term
MPIVAHPVVAPQSNWISIAGSDEVDLERNHISWVSPLGRALMKSAAGDTDLPQPPLAVLIVGVFTAIAVASSPRHHLRHGRAFPGEQKPMLIFQALQPARRYVVLDWRRWLVRFWFSCKPFSHLAVFPWAIQINGRTFNNPMYQRLVGNFLAGLHWRRQNVPA